MTNLAQHLRPDLSDARLARRHRAERRFRLTGIAAIALALGVLALLIASILAQSVNAFTETTIALDVHFDAAEIDPQGTGDKSVIARADFQGLARRAQRERFPEASGRRERRQLFALISSGAGDTLRALVLADPTLIGTTRRVRVRAAADIDSLDKGEIRRDAPVRRVSDAQLAWVDALAAEGRIERRFNRAFFTSGDSREPEQAGIWGAAVGSFFTLMVCLLLSFPVGVMAAVHLEEFAPRNRVTDLIEVNINNLAAVPSIVFGLLGLAVFLGVFGLPRSAPLVGGMVLALMTLPTVIISGRAALASVPPSIRAAALALGASPLQTTLHHVLPLAMPGMLTGTIIGMARALGETAPLLMIGMVAFIVDIPGGVSDPATALPVQVYLWADAPERAFAAKTAAAILVLLAFLACMNLSAVLLRRKFERRW
ncbi:MAG: phosphate ABC transporter permease PstA [Alphaproteobacteria bacterium]